MVSIIIPVYNVESYLQKSVQSAIDQTYNDLEIILVDDGSTDGSGKLCDELQQKDSRIRVFHKENGGVSSARNLGMVKMEGEYFFFLDADDYIDQKCIEMLLGYIRSSNADVVKCGISHEYFDGTSTGKVENGQIGEIDLKNANVDFSNKYDFAAVWGKLYRRKGNVDKFDEKIHYAEDYLFVIQYLLKSQKMVVIKDLLYHSITRNGSAVNSPYSYKRLTELFAYRKIYEMLENYPVARKRIAFRIAELCYFNISSLAKADILLSTEESQSLLAMQKEFLRYMIISKEPMKLKVMYLFSLMFPKVFCKYLKNKGR